MLFLNLCEMCSPRCGSHNARPVVVFSKVLGTCGRLCEQALTVTTYCVFRWRFW